MTRYLREARAHGAVSEPKPAGRPPVKFPPELAGPLVRRYMAVQRKAKPPVTVAGLREYLLQLGKPGDVSLSTLCLTKRCGIVFERPKNARDVGHETIASRVYCAVPTAPACLG